MKRSDFIPRAHARGIVRAGIALLLFALLAAAICGCGKKIEPADEGEAIAAAERLIGDADPWIRLFFTPDGMPYLENGRELGVYREVDGDAMHELGFDRLSDLKTYAKRIFSPSMCERFDAVLFAGDGAGGWLAALVENTALEYADDGTSRTVFLCFYADPEALPMLPGAEATFDFSRATVTENRGDFVKISVPASGVGENEGKTVNKTLDLLKIEGEWYLDNYPNVVFPKGEK